MQSVFLNGKFVSLNKAKVSVLDRGFQYGDGIFETMRSYNGKIFMLEYHLDRLLTSLKILKIKIPHSRRKLRFFINKTLNINKLKNAYIKLVISRGVSQAGIDIPKKCKPTVFIYATHIKKIPQYIYKKGIKMNFACIDKNEKSFVTRIKSLNYLDNILAREEAREGGFADAIFINSKGFVTEATTSNIFMVKENKIITPPPQAGLLAGITRRIIIKVIKKYFGAKLRERNIRPKEMLGADEVFLTNSILEIVPVVKLGKKKIGTGKAGVFTKLLHALYRAEVKNV